MADTKDRVFKFKGIQTQAAYLIKGKSHATRYFRYDGEMLQKTHDNDWFMLAQMPKLVEKKNPARVVSRYFELKDESFANAQILKRLEHADVTYWDDDDEEYVWKSDCADLKSLYRLVEVREEESWEPVAFEVETIYTFDNFNHTDTTIDLKAQRNHRWARQGERESVSTSTYSGSLIWNPVHKALFPSVVLKENCPVTLKSETLYQIIRAFVQDNIDREVAHISSDYNFCFTVKKYLQQKERIEKIEVMNAKGKSYKNRRYKERVIRHAGDVVVFDMTHKGEKRKGHTVLPDMEATCLADLNEKLNRLMQELIDFINTPIKLCECCDGLGVTGNTHKVETETFFQ